MEAVREHAATLSIAPPRPLAALRGMSLGDDPVRTVLALQRTAGNRATAALLRSAAPTSRLLQRRVVCPVGVDPAVGTGCYEVPDFEPGEAANDNAVPQAANDNAIPEGPQSGVRAAQGAEGAEGAEAAEAAEAAEMAEAAEAAELAEAAEAAEIAEAAIEGGVLLEEVPVAGWIIGTALIVGGAGYLAYRHFTHNSRRPAPAPPRPVSTPAPSNQPVMPPGLVGNQRDLWRECQQLHEQYKRTQEQAGSYASRMDELEQRLQNNRATAQDRIDFCHLLEERIRLVQQLHSERLRYINRGCDQFDWFNQGRTEAERREAHERELDHVDNQLENLYRLKHRFCP